MNFYARNDAHEWQELEADIDEDEREGERADECFRTRIDGMKMKRILLTASAAYSCGDANAT